VFLFVLMPGIGWCFILLRGGSVSLSVNVGVFACKLIFGGYRFDE
jgi:hypothetical protein